MSEYQYYEFLAIDRPLTEDEIDDLRSLSTRATITPVSFTNEYHWGNFKGDPDMMMERYFDTHVYVANWMTAIFMVRLPIDALSKETVQAAFIDDVIDIYATKTHWIITWSLLESEDYDRFGMEDGHGWMACLSPVRDELLRGDYRSLYIGWLAAVSRGFLHDDELEPPFIDGLGNLTAAQKELAEFLEVDPDLLLCAGIGRPAAQNSNVSKKEMDKWIHVLPRDEVNRIIEQLIEGKGQQAERSVRNQFAAWQRNLRPERTKAPLRSVGELRQSADKIYQARLEKEKQEREQKEIKRREERKAYLKTLSGDFSKAFKSVRESVELRTGRGYDEACRILVDIAEAYDLFSTKEQFKQELKMFMDNYLRRKAFIQRLMDAGIWYDK